MEQAEKDIQLERLASAGVHLSAESVDKYLAAPDDLNNRADVPTGYKRCGRCHHVKKFYLFNRNKDSKTNTTGNCKECQKEAAKKSYGKLKKKRNYKEYYEQNKDMKREQSRKYYAENKETMAAKQKEYRQSDKGRKVMNKAHSKRRKLLAENAGIPWTKEIVIQRDTIDDKVICLLCGNPIEDAKDIHMEHLIPVAQGGLNCFTNVCCAHSECNLRKSKDAREITADQVTTLSTRAEAFIDANPHLFDGLFQADEKL